MFKWLAIVSKIFATISYVVMSGILIIACAGILKQDFKTMGTWKMMASAVFIGLTVLLIQKYSPEDK